MKNNAKTVILTLTSAIGMTSAAFGQATTGLVATGNATIDSDGPTGSPWFHNAQVPGNFESYAISSFLFTPADFGFTTVTDVSSVRISYMQSNAGFTTDGDVEFFASFDTTVGGGSYGGLAHSGAGSGIADTEFSDAPSMQSLGTGTFTETASGDVDTYTLLFSGSVLSDLIQSVNDGNPFSILLTAPSGSTAATYAGLESNSYEINGGSEPDSKRTTLTVTAVPEPSAYGMIAGLLGLGCVFLRRTRR